MILIVSHKEDYTTDYVVNILNKRNIKYHRLNTEDIGERHNIVLNYEPKQISSIDGIKSFHSVWFRRTKLPQNKFFSQYEQEFYNRDYRLFLNSFWQSIRADKWLSHPDAVYRAENKLLQLSTAQEMGFAIPETVLTTKKKDVKKFYEKHKGKIILKPLFHGRYFDGENQKLIFTNQVKYEHLEQEGFSIFPIIFQAEVQKEYELRVTVVGDYVFTAMVNSQIDENTKTDWRRGHLKFEQYRLPQEIENKCIELVKRLNLNFGAIDLIKSKNQYVFLEINPNGQWAWIENDTGLEISNAIVDFLKN